jgi:hypothetical protein
VFIPFSTVFQKISKPFQRMMIQRLFLCCTIALGSLSLAAQTGNGCAQAITIVSNGVYTVDSITTTGSPQPDARKAKWFKYTPAQNGLMSIASCYSNSDTRLTVLTGRCDSLVPVGFNDDACESDLLGNAYSASLRKLVTAGKTYYIAWDNRWDSTRFTFTFNFSTFAPNALQTCATAQTVNLGTVRIDSLFGFATRGDAAAANWYRFTPLRSGNVTVTSCGGGVDSRVWIYRGLCNNLIAVADNDDACPAFVGDPFGLAASVTFPVTPNTTYYIEWDDAGGSDGFDFAITQENSTGTSTIETGKNNALQVFPNPAQDVLFLRGEGLKNETMQLRICNTLGQVLMTKQCESNRLNQQNYEWALEKTLPDGIYLLQWQSETTRGATKIQIQH